MKDPARRSPECNVVLIPGPVKLSDGLYLRAHALIDEVPKRRPLGMICGLERLVEGCQAEGKGGRPAVEVAGGPPRVHARVPGHRGGQQLLRQQHRPHARQ